MNLGIKVSTKNCCNFFLTYILKKKSTKSKAKLSTCASSPFAFRLAGTLNSNSVRLASGSLVTSAGGTKNNNKGRKRLIQKKKRENTKKGCQLERLLPLEEPFFVHFSSALLSGFSRISLQSQSMPSWAASGAG